MFSFLVIAVLCLSVIGVDGSRKLGHGGKPNHGHNMSDEEWKEAFDELLAEHKQTYKDGDLAAFRDTMVDDVHALRPGGLTVGTKNMDIDDTVAPSLELDAGPLRWKCGNGAVFEYTLSFDIEGVNQKGQGLALVENFDGKLRFKSFCFNLYA